MVFIWNFKSAMASNHIAYHRMDGVATCSSFGDFVSFLKVVPVAFPFHAPSLWGMEGVYYEMICYKTLSVSLCVLTLVIRKH